MKGIFSAFQRKVKVPTLKRRVAILGGSFDPVHKGHAQIVRKLCERFDDVIVVPAKISPFKLERETADSGDRLSMLRLALTDMPTAIISDFELKNGGISYTYLTALNFHTKDNSLFFVIGSEMLYKLHKWKNFNELIKLTSFYVVPRAGFEVNKEQVTDLERLGARIKVADFSCEDISSARIKVDLAFGLGKEHLDERVFQYINRYELYRDYAYITDRYDEFGLKEERIAHTYRAVIEGIRLAKIHGLEVERVVTALLLHDIGKNVTRKELKKYNINEYAEDRTLPEACRHAEVGAIIAKHCFNIEDEEILRAIKNHTTCAPFMSELEKVVAIADYIEAGRDFAGLEPIRQAAASDLDVCMELMLKSTIDYLKSRDVHKTTLDAYDYYRMLNAQKRLALQ